MINMLKLWGCDFTVTQVRNHCWRLLRTGGSRQHQHADQQLTQLLKQQQCGRRLSSNSWLISNISPDQLLLLVQLTTPV